ncbi:calcium release-activated calcium channel protein 1-like [Centruroides vittatus]|uniref:calcium release-activated calcium channel protein 1-like n=1 Tax=Centruroides vittatus TaxID=120091 RepID=UPI00350F4E9E
MSNQENGMDGLSWRRLHLSRAKLKASSRTSALLAGFAMVAMVEAQISDDLPNGLLIIFSICTTLLVSVHLLALMISTCILPNIEAVASINGLATVSESPHDTMHYYIEASWIFSTVFGIFLFLTEIAILCWIKFVSFSTYAALAGIALLIPFILLFVAFAIHFHRKLVSHKYEQSADELKELETMVTQLQSSSTDISQSGPYILNV